MQKNKKILMGCYGYSQYRETRKHKRKVRRNVAIILLLFMLGGLLYIGNTFYEYTISRTKEINLASAAYLSEYDKERVSVVSNDGLKLSAVLYSLNDSYDKYAVIVHGYRGSAENMKPFAELFMQNGYNTLLPDCRGHGQSEGSDIGMGWNDRFDLMTWITKIIKERPNSEIVLYGVSMGAAAVLCATGELLPDNVKCVIADCGYTSAKEIFNYQYEQRTDLPKFPVLQAFDIVTKARAGYWLSDASPIEQVKKSKTPTLFIHGAQDEFVPAKMTEQLFEAAVCEKEKLIIQGSGHEESDVVAPDVYWDTVFLFIKKYVSK